MKCIISPQEAIERVRKGHLGQLKGLDVHDFTHVFDNADEVTLLSFSKNKPASPLDVIQENETEIRESTARAKAAMVQLHCGKGNTLSMDDMRFLDIVMSLFPEDIEFSWDVEDSDSADDMLRLDLYVIN